MIRSKNHSKIHSSSAKATALTSGEKALLFKLTKSTQKKFDEGRFSQFEDRFWADFSKIESDVTSTSSASISTAFDSFFRLVSDKLNGLGLSFNLDFAYGAAMCALLLLSSISLLKTQEPMHVTMSRQDRSMVALNEGLLKDLDMVEDMIEIVADSDISIDEITDEEWDILTL